MSAASLTLPPAALNGRLTMNAAVPRVVITSPTGRATSTSPVMARADGSSSSAAQAGEMAGQGSAMWSGTMLFRRGMQAVGALTGGLIADDLYGG